MNSRPEAWLKQAHNDLALAELAKDSGFMTQACYHASQAAEKALKGALLELGIEPPHAHVLNELVQRLGNAGLNVAALAALPLRGLSRMAIQSRHPMDTTPPADLLDLADTEQAMKTPKLFSTLWPPSTLKTSKDLKRSPGLNDPVHQVGHPTKVSQVNRTPSAGRA